MKVINADVEDILWVRLSQGNEDTLILAVCYIPSESSSWGQGAEETLQLLSEQVAKFCSQGPLIICGDCNARCGELNTDRDGIPSRKVIDVVKNSQGKAFVDFHQSISMTEVNGRKGCIHLCLWQGTLSGQLLPGQQ